MIGAVIALAVACSDGGDSSDVAIVTFAPTESTASSSSTPPTSSAPAVTEATDADTSTLATQVPTTVAETEPTPATTPWPPSQELLDEAVLPISDMPSGWAEVPDDEEDEEPCGVSVSAILDLPEIPSGQAVYAEDENFGPLVFLSVGVVPPTEIDVLTTLKNGLLQCEPPDDDDGWSTRYSELSYPPLGDQSIALRITRTREDTTVYLDVVQARVGDVMIQVGGADVFGDSTAVVEQFAQPQLDRAVEVLG